MEEDQALQGKDSKYNTLESSQCLCLCGDQDSRVLSPSTFFFLGTCQSLLWRENGVRLSPEKKKIKGLTHYLDQPYQRSPLASYNDVDEEFTNLYGWR